MIIVITDLISNVQRIKAKNGFWEMPFWLQRAETFIILFHVESVHSVRDQNFKIIDLAIDTKFQFSG